MTGEARDTSARESFATTPTLGQTTPILHDRGYCTMQPRVSQ